MSDRFQQDLQRGREYIAAARPFAEEGLVTPAQREQHFTNMLDTLFGEYTCKRCASYQHKDSGHGDYCECCGSARKHPPEARDVCPTYERWAADQ